MRPKMSPCDRSMIGWVARNTSKPSCQVCGSSDPIKVPIQSATFWLCLPDLRLLVLACQSKIVSLTDEEQQRELRAATDLKASFRDGDVVEPYRNVNDPSYDAEDRCEHGNPIDDCAQCCE